MKLNIELNDDDLKKLYKLYTTIIEPIIQRTSMTEDRVVYELNCDQCAGSWELAYIEYEDSNKPMYCPFCGVDIDLTDIDDESENDLEYDELDFEQDY